MDGNGAITVNFNIGSLIFTVVLLASYWRIFQKMGRQGWEAIIPLYNSFVLFEELYGNGWRMLYLLIPFYNIYVAIKLDIDLCHAFNKYGGFVWGFVLLEMVFAPILAFGSAVYGDGGRAVHGDDPISRTLDSISGAASGQSGNEEIEKLRELDEMRKNGIITDEEFEAKKAELLKRM